MKKLNRGFTLIELLVVIAIIGILSAIVLASLSTARGKANDSKVQGQISGMRAAAEIYYTTNGNYGGTASDCDSGLFTDTSSGMNNLVDSTKAMGGVTVECFGSDTAWAVSANLPGTSGKHFCADSTGTATTTTAATTDTSC